jgi:hypothetical protein
LVDAHAGFIYLAPNPGSRLPIRGENEDDGLLSYDRSRLEVTAARVVAPQPKRDRGRHRKINARVDYRTGPGVAVAQPSRSLKLPATGFSNTMIRRTVRKRTY